MIRTFIAAVLMLPLTAPALAKPRDVFPVSCHDLWAAVKNTLTNKSNYGVLSMDDEAQTALFNIAGATRPLVNAVVLFPQDNGCVMKLAITESSKDDADEREFRKRLVRSLGKVQAGKPAAPAKAAGSAPGPR
jgi:hypothetical protein